MKTYVNKLIFEFNYEQIAKRLFSTSGYAASMRHRSHFVTATLYMYHSIRSLNRKVASLLNMYCRSREATAMPQRRGVAASTHYLKSFADITNYNFIKLIIII